MGTAKVEPLRKPVECPCCKAVSKRAFYPFCSKQCMQADLYQWFCEGYAIPLNEEQPYEKE